MRYIRRSVSCPSITFEEGSQINKRYLVSIKHPRHIEQTYSFRSLSPVEMKKRETPLWGNRSDAKSLILLKHFRNIFTSHTV